MAKKIPERKCMGCNAKKPKNELIRVVRSPEGELAVDTKGKMPGRGVYICCEANCFARVRKSKRLDSVLEIHIPDEIYLELERIINSKGEENDG